MCLDSASLNVDFFDHMNVIVTTEQRFLEHHGEIYTDTIGDYQFWYRYLEVFSEVYIVARIQQTQALPKGAIRADGTRVRFVALPDYIGLIGGMIKLPALLVRTRQIAQSQRVFILRAPGVITTLIYLWLMFRRWPFSLEVVGDPFDSLDPKILRRPWARGVRLLVVRALKRQCQAAACVCYVTREYLQNRYPPGQGYATYCSDVELSAQAFSAAAVYRVVAVHDRARLIFVGSLSQPYKGLGILLKALKLCVDRSIMLDVTVLGDGSYRSEYEQLAVQLGIQDLVTFHGYVTRKTVLQLYAEADLFVMPSWVEGLPRALLEAMASGLPCIASAVGGIPELLSAEDMVAAGDPVTLAAKIKEVLTDDGRLAKMSARNAEIAWQFRDEALHQRRLEFYQQALKATQQKLSVKLTDTSHECLIPVCNNK